MGLLRNRALWAALLGLVTSGLLLILGTGYLGLVVVSGLLSGAPVVETLLDLAVPAVVGGTLLIVLVLVSGVALLGVLLRSVSLPRSSRISSLAARLEDAYPPLRRVGLSDRFAPPEPDPEERTERALADLKARYIDGKIDEAEFERWVDRLVSDGPVEDGRAIRGRERERERVAEKESGGY